MSELLAWQVLDAMACDLRRAGHPERAGFMHWERVVEQSGVHDDDHTPLRYHFGGPHGKEPRWFVLVQMFYNQNEVRKLLTASDVVLINYGLHYCQPARAGADTRCWQRYQQYVAELERLFISLQAHASQPGKVAIFQETSAQHFPQVPPGTLPPQDATGDWEMRYFFPRLGPRAPEQCRCSKIGAEPLRMQALRNVSARYPAVRVLPMHPLLAPRHQWHQQDCRARSEAWHRAEREGQARGGCDCTHYCYSPAFWKVYFRALLVELRAGLRFSSSAPANTGV